ncbi:MAG TPA: ParB/RepB/Spo0J family partition protein [Candidatus Limousia pullorum]|uniref:ParB/RepB/Spo0J family partition protein n=1 Tax=Candidatus Limousia pullorum TaxID=2840860 RepID=A0A9D1LXR0_9FIRM|nr:ParB/RepB/Spo0J family partition protein [Candidatus Limousia pullorum]
MNFISKDGNKVVDIPIRQIRPNQSQPRKTFKDEELNSLAASIEENGILQPLTVRRLNLQEYELVAGERRLRAAVIAGLKRVPCIVIKCTDRESAIFALLENLQRSDLGMFEEARGISRLIRKYNLTQEEAAAKLGKKQSTVANKLRLLKLTMDEQDWINQAGLSERHARALLRIADENLRKEALSKVISESLNINQTEELVDNIISSSFIAVDDKHRKKRVVIKDVRIFINTINKAVDTMRLAGINAVSKRAENDDYIEYTVRIPKNISSKKDDTSDNKTA